MSHGGSSRQMLALASRPCYQHMILPCCSKQLMGWFSIHAKGILYGSTCGAVAGVQTLPNNSSTCQKSISCLESAPQAYRRGNELRAAFAISPAALMHSAPSSSTHRPATPPPSLCKHLASAFWHVACRADIIGLKSTRAGSLFRLLCWPVPHVAR